MTSSAANTFCVSCLVFLLATFRLVLSTSTPAASPCASQPCNNGGECIEYSTAFQCRCTHDFTGLTCDVAVSSMPSACDDNPCAHGACVSSASDRFTCMCPQNWRGTACEIDVNECQEFSVNPCVNNTVCINEDGGYRCEAPCSDPNPCQNGGTCSITRKAPYFTCDCLPRYEGDTCDVIIETDDPCRSAANTCQNGGTCFSFGGAAICYCLPGFQGELCEIDTDVCHTIECQNGGTCLKSRDQTATCVCPPFYSGSLCDVGLTPCSSLPCNASTTCIEDLSLASGFTCMPPCAKDPCLHGGTCINNQSSALGFVCTCGPDYQGAMCEQMIPPCSRDPCLNGGTCVEDVVLSTGYRCMCPPGFQGSLCEVVIVSPCASDPCKNGGTCEPTEGALTEFRCRCEQGYKGATCDIVLHPVCTFEGVTYQDSTTRKEECNICHCQEGSWHCTDKFCGQFVVSFEFDQANTFSNDVEFSNFLKEDIAEYFDINVNMIQVLTVSGNPSEIQFQLQDTIDSNVDIENVAADMLSQFVTGSYAFHYNRASYSINSQTVTIERREGEVTDHGTDGDGQQFISTTLIAVCVVVSTILVVAVLFGVIMIVVYKRRSRKEQIYCRKDKNTNAQSNNATGGAIKYHKNVYNAVPPRESPSEVSEIRIPNGGKPDVNINMEAKV